MPSGRDWVERVTDARVCELLAIPGGAGRREYFRVRLADGSTRILMHAAPEDEAILPPALRRRRDRLDFIEITRMLAGHGVPVPEIHAAEPARRWVLLEDLGDRHVADLEGEELRDRLQEAARLLARVHLIPKASGFPFDRAFDREWICFELEHFIEHGGPRALPAEIRPAVAEIAERTAELPRVLCLRDYQSRNLMIDPAGRLRVLDYQDALLAPAELDLAAFLHDSYLELDAALRRVLLSTYESVRGVRVEPSSLAILVVQRKCKDFGRYRYLTEVRGDARFAPYRARARDSILAVLDAAPLSAGARSALRQLLEETTP
jgi:hypothetical protein